MITIVLNERWRIAVLSILCLSLIAIEAAGIKILTYHLMHTCLVHSLLALWVNYLVEISIQMFLDTMVL